MNELEIDKRCQSLLRRMGYNAVENIGSNWELHYISSCPVFVGEKDGEKRIAKFARTGDDWSNRHLLREAEVLREFQDCPGIPRFYGLHFLANSGIYYNQAVSFLLFREFLEGEIVSREGEITNKDHIGIVGHIVFKLHEAGYAGLDIKKGNVLAGKCPGIIDFGSLRKLDEVSLEEFVRLAVNDASCIERFIGFPEAV